MNSLLQFFTARRLLIMGLLIAAVIAAVAVWLTRPSESVIALGRMNFSQVSETIEADLFDKYGCVVGEEAISTPDASGYGSAGLNADGSLPDDLVQVFEREVHEIEHVTDYRISATRALLLAHDLPDFTGRHTGDRVFSTLTEIVSLTGGTADVERWEVVQVLFLIECTEAEREIVRQDSS